MFYFTVFLILVSFSLISITNYKGKTQEILLLILFFIFWLVAGLRYETGGDWYSYSIAFGNMPKLNELFNHDTWLAGYEAGFTLLCSVTKSLGGSVQTLFLIVTFINMILIFNAVKKYTNYPVISLMIYFSIFYFTIEMMYVRQSLALSIFIFSIKYINGRKFVPYLLCCLLSMSFHISAIILLFLYFINRTIKQHMVALLLLGGIFIYFTRIGWFTNFIMSILNFSDDNFTSKLILYLTREQFAQSRTLSFGVLVYILAVAIALFNYKELVKIKYFNIFFNLFLINVLIYFYCYELIELTNRVRWFFFIGIIIILPDYIIILKNKLNKLTYCTAIICLCFLYARLIFMESSATLPYNPYQNYVVYKVFNLNSTGMERTLIYNNQ